MRLALNSFGTPMDDDTLSARREFAATMQSDLTAAAQKNPDLGADVSKWASALAQANLLAKTDDYSAEEKRWSDLFAQGDAIIAKTGTSTGKSKPLTRFEDEYISGQVPKTVIPGPIAKTNALQPLMGGAILGVVAGYFASRRGDRTVPLLAGGAVGSLFGLVVWRLSDHR